MGNTSIEWTDVTWNPVRGCSRVSEGCRNCYAEQQAARIVRMGRGKPTAYDGLVRSVVVKQPPDEDGVEYDRREGRWTGDVRLVAEHLADPLKWRKPRRIFVNSMSDLFHEKLSNEQIAAVFGVMAACPQHTFQCLTKRSARMREWFQWLDDDGHFPRPGKPFNAGLHRRDVILRAAMHELNGIRETFPNRTDENWPLDNVWLGVSVEHQDAADERIPELLDTPAAVRFLSCEPLLGPVDIAQYFDPCSVPCGEEPWPELDWLIAGCESGPGARPCDVAWLRSLRDQCAAAQVPFFLKQAKVLRDGMVAPISAPPEIIRATSPDRIRFTDVITYGPNSKVKARDLIALPYLDGVQHADFPDRPIG